MNKKTSDGSIEFEELKSQLNSNVQSKLVRTKITPGGIPAIDLLTADRFDVLAKYIYVEHRMRGIKSNFGRDIYLSHMNAFNGFIENEKPKKIGPDEFVAAFDRLIASAKNNEFNPPFIPLASNGSIVDGAHRVAVAVFLNVSVPVVETNIEPQRFDYLFFEQRGLEKPLLDAMAFQYLKLKPNVHAVLIWPSAVGREKELIKIFSEYGKIVYRKDVFLSGTGPVQLIRNVYRSESWLGSSKDDFAGARFKAGQCFNGTAPLRIILLESNKNMVEMKEEIRHLFQVGKHSVHINDTKSEAEELCGALLNDNSIHWLNNSILRDFSWFSRLFLHYKTWIKENSLAEFDFCVDGSSSLAAYGIREVRDLDFLCHSTTPPETGFVEIGCHNDELDYHTQSKDEIIYNPENHFFIQRHKFSSIDIVASMKRNRAEPKDLADLASIDKLKLGNFNKVPIRAKLQVLLHRGFWKGRAKFFLLKCRYFYTKWVISSGGRK
jgi:hypothetical protein